MVEDNDRDRENLRNLLRRFEKDSGVMLRMLEYRDGAELLENYQPGLDIILLDIQMAGIDGVKAATAVRRVDDAVIIIFVTKTAQYAVSGYAVQAQSYLLKPVSYFALETELNRGIDRLKRTVRESILIGPRSAPRRSDIADIIYIESRRHQLTVYLMNETLVFNGTLKDYEVLLADKGFYRSNSSFLINLRHLTSIQGEDAVMFNDHTLKISRARKRGLLDALTQYIGVQST